MVDIKFSNRVLYTFMLVVIIIIAGVSVYALTAGTAGNPGHTMNSIAPPSECLDSQVLQWNEGNGLWRCVDMPTSGSSGANSLFISPGEGVTTASLEGDTQSSQGILINFAESVGYSDWNFNIKVPEGANGIASIKLYVHGQASASSGNVYLGIRAIPINTDTSNAPGFNPEFNGDAYAVGVNLFEPLIINSQLALDVNQYIDGGDLVDFVIFRDPLDGTDNYGANLYVYGVEIAFN